MSDDGEPEPAGDGVEQLAHALAAERTRARADPFSNPFLLFALRLARRLGDGRTSLDAIEADMDALAFQAVSARAERLGAYLGPCDPAILLSDLEAVFERLAAAGDFDAFAAAVHLAPFGIVLTAHPTFSLSWELSRLLVELATGREADGRPFDLAGRAERLEQARRTPQGPPADLTLDVEHTWSVAALENVHAAMEAIYPVVLRVARARWPERWTELTPRLLTLATWVGFDQDGRTDVTWQISFAKRLALKQAALQRRLRYVEALAPSSPVRSLADLLRGASAVVERQAARLEEALRAPETLPAFAQAMVEGRDAALVETGPLVERIEAALAAAETDEDRERLLVLRASVATEGVSLARIHVRLNSGQLHNAVRRRIGLETSPADPANRRSYFAAIDQLIGEAQPVAINFGDLAAETASAPRLMMSVAQMRKFVDGSTPVRFLIAETETGFTLLAALYFARLFGVEDHVEISPLFETPEAFERGEKVLEEALRSEHFRAYVERHGRLAIEFGFSDSGRFVGQMAATFRIERLRGRLASMLEEHGLTGLEVVFFNTHGESIGRGGHPASLADRFRYAAPPYSRADYVARGIVVREEDAFQGGEGYLPLLTYPAALASVTAALQSVLVPDPEAVGDPIYDDPDFAAEFFATVEQGFTSVVADPDYAALIGLFGTHLLPKTGSRPVQRQAGDAGAVRTLGSVSELRAIPNNALLQQLGYLVNTLFGVGQAAAKGRVAFGAMDRASPRFHRALEMVRAAARASDLQVMRAYAAAVDPGAWLDRASTDDLSDVDRQVAQVAERTQLSERLGRFLRRLQSEDMDLRRALGPGGGEGHDGRRDRLLLLHALRLALIQRLAELAAQLPSFEPRGAVTEAVLRERLLRLDVPTTLEALREIFPQREHPHPDFDFGEESTYGADHARGYAHEHEVVLKPIARLYGLMLRLTNAITHEVGAVG